MPYILISTEVRRNCAEAHTLGIFTHTHTKTPLSSIDMPAILLLEIAVMIYHCPQWPQDLLEKCHDGVFMHTRASNRQMCIIARTSNCAAHTMNHSFSQNVIEAGPTMCGDAASDVSC